jgi:putative transposase
MMQQRLDYLHNNTVEAGSVESPPDYFYSSTKDYYTGQPGLLPIILLS